MADEIKNVVLIGAGGNLGPSVLKALLDGGKFEVTILSRQDSKSTFPSDIKVVRTDYSDASLAEVFKGQDAVISTINSVAVGEERRVIDAAVKAGVKRFIPSEFASNTTNKNAQDICPFFSAKAQTVDYLKGKANENPAFSWTAIKTGPFFDWCIQVGFTGFDLKSQTATIWDGGDIRTSNTNLAAIGQGVAGVLKNPSETKNRYIHLQSFAVTQNEILKELEKATGKQWQVNHVKSADKIKEGREKMNKGDFSGFPSLILGALFNGDVDTGSDFSKAETVDNALVGLPEKEDLKASVEAILKEK